jgi:hypothetical protein
MTRPVPTRAERDADRRHTELTGPHDRYTWLRYGDGPDAVELAATEEGIAIRHGGARFTSIALTFPAEEFAVFLTAADTTPGSPLAELFAIARELHAAEAARPKPRSLLEPVPPRPAPPPPTAQTHARIHDLRIRINRWLNQPPP